MDFRKLVESYQEDFLKDLKTLVSIESVEDYTTAADNAPFGKGCRDALDAMLNIAKRDGFECHDVDGYAGYLTYGDQEESFGLLGHLDIVPLGQDWTKPALDTTIKDGYIFGRGVMDDKGPTLCAYYALKMIKDQNISLKKKIYIITGCNEESGSACMKYYKKHAPIPDMGFVPDADFPVIYGEKGGLHVELTSNDSTVIKSMHAGSRPNIVIGKADVKVATSTQAQEDFFFEYCALNDVKGTIEKVDDGVIYHIDGVFAHASTPWLGVNAAVHLLHFIGHAYSDALAKDLYDLVCDWQGKPMGIYKDSMHMGFLTLNVGIVDIENDSTKILLDIRYPDQTDSSQIIENMTKACSNKASNITATLTSDSIPLFVDPNSELVQNLMDVYKKYTGDMTAKPITIGGGTYAREFKNFVSFGPVFPNQPVRTNEFVGGCHQRDEGIYLEDLWTAIAIYAEAIVALCA